MSDTIREAMATGRVKLMEQLLYQALKNGQEPLDILENTLLPSIREIGLRYKNNDSDLVQIMVAARCMQHSMDILQPYLNKLNRRPLGKVLLGTVEGDLHDVGKKLVAVMLRSVGFEVVDLGVDVSGREFIRAAKEHPDADIVCLSCLLTTSMDAMRNTVRMLRRDKDLSYLMIMVGGSPISQKFAASIGADAYTENAIDAAEVAKQLCTERKKKQ